MRVLQLGCAGYGTAVARLALFPADGWQEEELRVWQQWIAAASQRITIASREHAESYLQWLPRHGQHLTGFGMLGFPQLLQQLPCANLLELCVEDCSVQLGPAANGQLGVVQGCTLLTCLELGCNISDTAAGSVLDSLSALVHLQHLSVLPKVQLSEYSVAGLPVATLPYLEHLTHLSVDSLSLENL